VQSTGKIHPTAPGYLQIMSENVQHDVDSHKKCYIITAVFVITISVIPSAKRYRYPHYIKSVKTTFHETTLQHIRNMFLENCVPFRQREEKAGESKHNTSNGRHVCCEL